MKPTTFGKSDLKLIKNCVNLKRSGLVVQSCGGGFKDQILKKGRGKSFGENPV
jgi:hypothetical protein